jgi:hypothetical protein
MKLHFGRKVFGQFFCHKNTTLFPG